MENQMKKMENVYVGIYWVAAQELKIRYHNLGV